MNVELIIALMGSPILTVLATSLIGRRDAKTKNKIMTESTAFTRLEEENKRAATKLAEKDARIAELETSEDKMRDERNQARTEAAYWRGKVEGVGASLEAGPG